MVPDWPGSGGAEEERAFLRRTQRRRQADEWALALASQGLHPSIVSEAGGFVLSVRAAEREPAEGVLAAYEAENRPVAMSRARNVDAAPLRHAALLSAALLAFFLVTGARSDSSAWFERGSADAARILAGEPWRAVTALTLHADGAHVAGNALLGAVFWSAVFRSLGPGLGLALLVAAGALGNLANAYLHTDAHVSVGASTAVFGAIGLLGGLGLTHRLELGLRGKRAFVPVAAGLGLLAMLGTGGERIDIWAHAFGLVAGLMLGVGTGRLAPRHPGPVWQGLAGLAGAAVVVGSWLAALH